MSLDYLVKLKMLTIVEKETPEFIPT